MDTTVKPYVKDFFLTMTQTAELLAVNRITVRRWLKRGILTGESVGTATLIPRAAVEQLAQHRKATSTFGVQV